MTLKEHIEARVLAMEKAMATDPGSFEGHDWFQLSAAEEEVFGIDRQRFPRMLVAWQLYQALTGIVAAEDHELDENLMEAARKSRPDLEDGELSNEQFQKVAADLVSLSSREAYAMYMKTYFWDIRAGIVTFGDQK